MATIDQKTYLQKYLSGVTGDKKKKKKKQVKGKGFKIIDDDIDISKLRPLDGDEIDLLDHGEDAPVIAGIIDERPEDVKKLEDFKISSKWRVVNKDDGFNSKLQIEEIKRTVTETQKENELIFGKMYSDSEDEKKNDSDASPPRKNVQSDNKERSRATKKPLNNSDSDFSPPRRKDTTKSTQNRKLEHSTGYDSDLSPTRINNAQKSTDRVRKPSRWNRDDRNEERSSNKDEYRSRKSKHSKNTSDTELLPPKKSRKQSSDNRKHEKERQHLPDSDLSPLPRDKNRPPQRRNRSPDSDISPVRKSRKGSPQKKRRSDDSDISPPRKTKRVSPRKSPSSDISPPRRGRKHSPSTNKRVQNSALSPRNRNQYRRSSDSPPPTNKKMAKTLEGKQAGLQDANQLKVENEAFRRREEEAFKKMTDDVSGRNAKIVSRKSGKRETSEERNKQREKAERQKELDEKYKKWGKGLKQLEAQEQRVQDFIHEANKPLARHKDDKDLEDVLKMQDRRGDPMLGYMREKKRERGELPPERPMYKGSFPPNRFNIRPGYRWDGVDRSNGYEKKFFEQQSKRKAQEEEAYKWSTADL